MYISKDIDNKDQLSLSHNFESACYTILKELQLMLPCDFWFIAHKEQLRWNTLYALPSDGIDVNAFSQQLDCLSNSSSGLDDIDMSPDFVGVPLKANDSIFDGVICGFNPQFKQSKLKGNFSLIKLLAEVISYQLETEFKLNHQKYKIQQLINLSHTDSLTQLLNHRAWSQLLMVEEARAKRYQQPVTIFIVDLDKLKVVNDTKGHHAGDQLIIDAANCLRDVCRESDLVARLGGDEFGLLAIECDQAGAEVLQKNIHDAFEAVEIDASVGYCVMSESMTILETIHLADKQMYKSKNGKNKDSRNPLSFSQAEFTHEY